MSRLLQIGFNHFSGFIRVHNDIYPIELYLQNDNDNNNNKLILSSLSLSPLLLQLLSRNNDMFLVAVKNRWNVAKSVDAFVEELQDVLERFIPVNTNNPNGNHSNNRIETSSAKAMIKILQGIENHIGWNNVTKLHNGNDSNVGLQCIEITFEDGKKRKHTLELTFSPDDGEIMRFNSSLPIQFKPTQRQSFPVIKSEFLSLIHQFQDVFDVLDDIDENTWVLEPERPTRSILLRRFVIAKHISLQIELNAYLPFTIPNIRLVGPERSIASIRSNLSEKLSKWDEILNENDRNVRLTLLATLQPEIESFPLKTNQENVAEMAMECGICYAYRLDGLTPDAVCDNSNCGRSFHTFCLSEWLRSLPSSRQSFNKIFGTCPYCTNVISCKVSK